MSVVHNVSTATCGSSVRRSIDQHSVASTSAGHMLDGSGRCKRCSHGKRDSHSNSDADGNHNTCSFLCIHVPRRSDDMCCIKHYCDSDSFSRQTISLENVTSAEVTRRDSPGYTNDAEGIAETVESASSGISASTNVYDQTHAASSDVVGAADNPVRNDHCGGDDDDEDSSNSATSMLRNKKKPRSRLKKFLTSLLSLSSSSSDEEH